MPSVIPDYVNTAREGVQQAGQAVQGFAGKEFTIEEELKKVLNEATTPGKTDWANIRSGALSDYLAAPIEARAKYRDPESSQYIFNPAQSAQAMSEYTQGAEIPFLTANTLFSMFADQEKDIINSGTNAFKAKQAAAQAAYQTAQDVYSSLLREFELSEQVRSQQEYDKLSREKFELDKANKGSGGGGDLSGAFSLIQELLGGNAGTQPAGDITAAYELTPEEALATLRGTSKPMEQIQQVGASSAMLKPIQQKAAGPSLSVPQVNPNNFLMNPTNPLEKKKGVQSLQLAM